MRTIPEDDMNDADRAGYAGLAHEQDPGPVVEDRIVRALKDRGLLHGGRAGHGAMGWARLAAACLVLFGGGVALGEYHGGQRAEQRLASARNTDGLDAAMRVQQTGSAYVEAIAHLAEISKSGGDLWHTQQGREVAVSAIEAAATELHQVSPDDPFTAQLLDAIAASRASQQKAGPVVRRVIY